MARKKVTEQVLKSWDEVNDSLKLIGEAQNAIDTIEAELKGKSKKLAFGTLGFRLSTKLILPKAIKTVIESLQRNGMMDCLTTKVTVNKEVLKTYDEAEILNVGASLKREDTFWYETDRHTVQDE